MRLGVRIAHDVGGRHGFPVIRVGMHTGPATQRDRDWFGATVNLAARISALAGCDEVLLSDATRTQAGTLDGIVLRERGRRPLRNVAEPVLLFEVLRETGRSTSGLPVDPVCRMAVDPDNAAGSLRHDGVTYYLCSLPCVHSFTERPDRYTSNAAPRHGQSVPRARGSGDRAGRLGGAPDDTRRPGSRSERLGCYFQIVLIGLAVAAFAGCSVIPNPSSSVLRRL